MACWLRGGYNIVEAQSWEGIFNISSLRVRPNSMCSASRTEIIHPVQLVDGGSWRTIGTIKGA